MKLQVSCETHRIFHVKKYCNTLFLHDSIFYNTYEKKIITKPKGNKGKR